MLTTRTSQLTERFEEALVFAHQLHRLQVRKSSGVPYIAHLLSVTALVLEAGGSEDEAIAALLHDAVEDQGGAATREQIRQRFGEAVTAIVDGCTESDTIPKPPWRDRKQSYLEHLDHASPSVLRVSLADKLHNARSLLADYHQQGESIWTQFSGGKAGTFWFYRCLIEVYQERSASCQVQELERVMTQLEQLAESVPSTTRQEDKVTGGQGE
jgi:(p)ppGpp synthase/HD superfamily hydrolase